MKNITLQMIGNAHIDPVWLWRWQEGFHEVKATFRAALDFLKEYPDFTFVASSAALYEWVEQSDPDMFREIQHCVREGRWILVGGMWIEPDCNLPCGESFVRHVLYAQRFFLEKFDRICQVGYNIDSFGHNGMLPQILLKGGMPSYIFMRPMAHEKNLPGHLFWWEARDGSQVLTFRLPFTYVCDDQRLPEHARRCAEELAAPFDETMCFYGVGDHGGGPTRKAIDLVKAMDQDPDFPANLGFGNPDDFFDRVKNKKFNLPVVNDDLQHHASGCYAAHSGVKSWNRLAENRLLVAEKWSSIATQMTGQPYPADFKRAWKNVLFNQFHDILAGTSLESAYHDVRDTYGEACVIADRALNLAMQAVAWNIRILVEDGMRPIVVFNPHAWKVKMLVELDFDRWEPGAVLVDEKDQEVAYQAEDSPTTPWRRRLIFLATLPALGYETYRFRPGKIVPAEFAIENQTNLSTMQYKFKDEEALSLENEHLLFTVSVVNGISLYDKKLDHPVFNGPAAIPVVIDDPSDTWSHGILRFDCELDIPKQVSLCSISDGPVRKTILLTHQFGKSEVRQYFSLYPELAWIEVKVQVDWHERHRMLKLRFPVNIQGDAATYEIPYGHIQRAADGEEEPMQNWLDVSGKVPGMPLNAGLSLINDGKYSADVRVNGNGQSDIGLTVLRSPVYAHHDPAILETDGDYAFMDQGFQQFHYLLLPHAGNWKTAGTVQRAVELNQPAHALVGTFHPHGKLPQSSSAISVSPGNILVTVFKQAEDGKGWVIRAFEVIGEETNSVIEIPILKRTIELDFRPSEIKTFYVPLQQDLPVMETNLLEMFD